jgi:hypothetical protein
MQPWGQNDVYSAALENGLGKPLLCLALSISFRRTFVLSGW